MIWLIIRQLGFFTFIILTIWFVSKKKYEYLLWLFFFTLPFQNCAQFLAVTVWNPYKIVALGMAWVILFHPSNRSYPAPLLSLFRYFLIMICLTTVFSLAQPPNNTPFQNAFFRLIVQDFTYLLGFIPLLFIKWLPLDFGVRAWKWYSVATIVLIIIGIVHFIFIKLNIPFSPIIRDFGQTNESAGALFGGLEIKRIYGFCGEPKNMAFAITPFIVCMLIRILNYKDINAKILILTAFAIFVFINTYSSAAYIEFVIGFTIYFISIKWLSLRKHNLIGLTLFSLFAISFFILYFDFSSIQANNDVVSNHTFLDSFYDRSFGRAQEELEEGRTEILVTETWLHSDNIIYYLFGFGPGLYSYHCDLTFSRGFLPVQSGLVLNLVDFGIIGYIFFFYLIRWIYIHTKNINFCLDTTATRFWVIAGCILIGNMMYSMMGGAIIIGLLPYIAITYWIDENQSESPIHLSD